jgi:3-mercaptopyruvate sulfurtransferase SseA
LFNEARNARLPVFGDCPAEALLAMDPAQGLLISFEEAHAAFLSRQALFIDARCPDLYQEGHIQGALNLPWDDNIKKTLDEATEQLSEHSIMIAYCDGEDCGLGRELALELFFRNNSKVRILENGWSRWRQHSLPVVKGPSPY